MEAKLGFVGQSKKNNQNSLGHPKVAKILGISSLDSGVLVLKQIVRVI